VAVADVEQSRQVTARVIVDDDGAGRLTIGGARYLLIRPETLAALQKQVETAAPGAAADCLVAGGRAGGARATRELAGDAEMGVRTLLEIGRALGWGDFALERLGARELVVTVAHLPFAEAYGPSTGPVCHLTRGVLESLAARVLGRPLAVRETACAATGAPRCRFATVPETGAREQTS
jgi:predicted hydrocarbon binding protein